MCQTSGNFFLMVREKKNLKIALQTKILGLPGDRCRWPTPVAPFSRRRRYDSACSISLLSFIESRNCQLLAHFSLDLDKFFFPDYQQTISRRLAKPEFASEASETSEMPFTFSTLKKWDSSYLGRLRSLVFVGGFSNFQRCWTAVDEDSWLERFSRLASLALKSAFRSLRPGFEFC